MKNNRVGFLNNLSQYDKGRKTGGENILEADTFSGNDYLYPNYQCLLRINLLERKIMLKMSLRRQEVLINLQGKK
jgi:hypothetical protein